MNDTTPKFLESVTEHPDVQRLIGQVETLSQENKRLSQRDCNASVQILLPTADSPFNKEDCRIVDVGVSDNIYVVECDAVVELEAENERLNSIIAFAVREHKNFKAELKAKDEEIARLRSVIHDVIILTDESSTKEFAEQALKGE